ncbi:hypothetical protein [Modestobacter sp. SYSU DS0657]
MSSGELEKPAGVRRLVYKELLAGDYRKLAAKSNDSDSGGGARDLRFSYKFDGIFARLLPGSSTKNRTRKGIRVEEPLRTGPVYLDEETETGVETTVVEMVWETPTDARPSEGRIAKVHASPATRQLLAARDAMRDENGNPPRVFVLFVQDDQGELRVHYAYEKDLRAGEWAPAVAKPMLGHLDNVNRRRDRAVAGYIDFIDNVHYAHDVR